MTSFAELDARRAACGITRKQLYEAARIHKETWRRLARGNHAPNTRTIEKLEAALESFEKTRRKAA